MSRYLASPNNTSFPQQLQRSGTPSWTLSPSRFVFLTLYPIPSLTLHFFTHSQSGPTLVVATEFVGSIELGSSGWANVSTRYAIVYIYTYIHCFALFCQEKLFRDSEFYFTFMLAYILLFLFVTIGIFNLIMVPDLRVVQILYQSVRQLICEGSLCWDMTINKRFGSNEHRDQSESTPKNLCKEQIQDNITTKSKNETKVQIRHCRL